MQAPEQARQIAEALVERGIAAGATAADALYAGDRSSSVEVRLGETEQVSRSEGEQIGLRLFLGQRSATVASSDLSDEALGVLVERCLAMAKEAPEDVYAGLAPPELLERGEPPFVDSYDGLDPDPAELRARALEAEAAALAVSGSHQFERGRCQRFSGNRRAGDLRRLLRSLSDQRPWLFGNRSSPARALRCSAIMRRTARATWTTSKAPPRSAAAPASAPPRDSIRAGPSRANTP